MLILSRKEDQKIRIGNNIVINIVSISDKNVRIGIEADKDVKIYREEIYSSVTEHIQQAVSKSSDSILTNINSFELNKIDKKNGKI